LVVRAEMRGGTASLAFPPSFAASRGGMMSEMNAVGRGSVCGFDDLCRKERHVAA
jgi:hypothetical protein